MSIQLSQTQQIYGIGSPIQNNFPFPQGLARALTTSDQGLIGQVVVALGVPYMMTAYGSGSTAGQYIWTQLETSGGGGVFSSLTVTPGPVSLTGTTTINTTGSATTTIGTGGTGAVNIGNATGNTAVTGALAATGNISSSAGSLSAFTTITAGTNITATTGNIVATAGNIAASNGTVTGDVGLIATTGNITASDGNVVLSTAGTYISMPGPVFIYSGAGAPSNGLALHAGDMYIRTDPAGATSRLYIATAASTWTNVTCAA